MKDVFKTYNKVIKELLKVELGSTGGKVNLLGGLLVIVLTVAIFFQDVVMKIINSFTEK